VLGLAQIVTNHGCNRPMGACIRLCKQHGLILALAATVDRTTMLTRAQCEAQCLCISLYCLNQNNMDLQSLCQIALVKPREGQGCATLHCCRGIRQLPYFLQCDCGSAKMISLSPPKALQSIATCANPTSPHSWRQYGYQYGTSTGRMGTSGASLHQAELIS